MQTYKCAKAPLIPETYWNSKSYITSKLYVEKAKRNQQDHSIMSTLDSYMNFKFPNS